MASIYDNTAPPPGYIWDGHGGLIPNPNPYAPPLRPSPVGLPSPSGQPNSGSPEGAPWTPPDGAQPITSGSATPPGFTADYPHGYYIPIAGWQAPAAPPPAPPAAPKGGGGGGGPAPGSAPTGPPGGWPQFPYVPYTPATSPKAPPPFDPGAPFTAPTLDEAKNQPGYQFGLQQGLGALETANAAKGLARGGGALKGLFDYGNAAAEQNYANVYSQDANTYNTNLASKLGAYTTNWGVTKDVSSLANSAAEQNYQNEYQNQAGIFNPKFQAASLSFQDQWLRWQATLDALTKIQLGGST